MDQNWGNWLGVVYDNPVVMNSKWNYLLIAQLRLLNRPEIYQQTLLNAGVFYTASRNWNFGGGYRFFNVNRPNRSNLYVNRIYQTVGWATSFLQEQRIFIHSQLEERFRVGEYKMALRLRERLTWDYILSKKLTFVFSNEVFIGLIRPAWVGQSTFDQNRLFIGFSSKRSDQSRVVYGYLNQYLVRRPKNIMRHILLVMLVF